MGDTQDSRLQAREEVLQAHNNLMLLLLHTAVESGVGCREEAVDCGCEGNAASGRLHSLESQAPGASFSRSIL